MPSTQVQPERLPITITNPTQKNRLHIIVHPGAVVVIKRPIATLVDELTTAGYANVDFACLSSCHSYGYEWLRTLDIASQITLIHLLIMQRPGTVSV